jgi:hypothetical protein
MTPDAITALADAWPGTVVIEAAELVEACAPAGRVWVASGGHSLVVEHEGLALAAVAMGTAACELHACEVCFDPEAWFPEATAGPK